MDGTAVNFLIYHMRGRWALRERAPLPTYHILCGCILDLSRHAALSSPCPSAADRADTVLAESRERGLRVFKNVRGLLRRSARETGIFRSASLAHSGRHRSSVTPACSKT